MLKRALTSLSGSRSGRIAVFLLPLSVLVNFILICSLTSSLIDVRTLKLLQWRLGDSQSRLESATVKQATCPGAPFALPAERTIGLFYADTRAPYSKSNPHQGIDIISDAESGVSPVYAAFDGYISREPDWRSTLIQRIPDDPLDPGQQIWLYYTHMADKEGNDFIIDELPPGTHEFFIKQGTLLGYTGDYNGNSIRGVWVHLHFSIIRDNGQGGFTNELDFDNSVDPSPYLGINVNYQCASSGDLSSGCSQLPICGG